MSSKLKQIKMHYSHNAFNVHFTSVFHKWKHIFIFHIITKEPGQNVWLDLAFTSQNLKFSGRISNDILQVCLSTYFVSNLSFKDGAYSCYCAYVLRISRHSDFQSPMLTNTGIFLRGLKLSGENRS